MRVLKSPCKDCTERALGCHANCSDYILFSNERRKINDERWKAKTMSRYEKKYRDKESGKTFYVGWGRNQ